MPRKVLLIEYEPRYLEKVREFFAGREADYQLVIAKDGEQGLEFFTRHHPELILISSVLPKVRTAEVVREIRQQGGVHAPPIILMMSGYRGSNKRADAQKVGAYDILEKPFEPSALQNLVDEALGAAGASRTVRLDLASTAAEEKLTANDIFSDLLKDIAPETHRVLPPTAAASASFSPAGPPAAAPPVAPLPPVIEEVPAAAPAGAMPPPKTGAPPAPPRSTAHPGAMADVEKRLEETLSGILTSSRKQAARSETPAPEAPRPTLKAASAPQVSDVDRMLSETLSGIGVIAKPRPSGSTPTPVTPISAAAPPAPEKPPPAASSARGAAEAPPKSSATIAPGSRFGSYEIIERAASGGMAEVYKARMSGVEGFQKIVAIKKILPHLSDNEDFVRMFTDEAKLAAQLNHNNIIHIYDLGRIDDAFYIAMEYVDGRDLRSILKSGQEHGVPLPPELATFIASKLAAALDYAHRKKDFEGSDLAIVHRDVSPQNVLISYEGDIKLCDFGIAKAASKASQTQSGALKGKLQYMSPEQAWGKKIDRRSDIFSLGGVLYEMLTGEKLFAGDNDLNVLERVRDARVEPPSRKNPAIASKLDAIVMRALAKEPDDRYQNASDMQRDLESVLYTYSPAPGSADMAIYLHHLQAEERAGEEERARVSSLESSTASEEPRKPKKAKGATLTRRPPGLSTPTPPPAAPARLATPAPTGKTSSGVFGAYSSKKLEAEKKRRLPLLLGVGAAAVVLVGLFLYLRGVPLPGLSTFRTAAVARAPKAAAPSSTTAAPPPTTPVVVPSSASAAAPPVKVYDQKAINDEVKRQVAARISQLEKEKQRKLSQQEKAAVEREATGNAPPTTPPASPRPERAPAATASEPVVTAETPRLTAAGAPPPGAASKETSKSPPAEPAPTESSQTSVEPAPREARQTSEPAPQTNEGPAERVPSAPLAAAPAPKTAVAKAAPPAQETPKVETPAVVHRGDLVGPGPGVTEPELLTGTLHVNYPLLARQQGISGEVVLLVEIDETGKVISGRVVRGTTLSTVNRAVLEAVRRAKFKPAVKDGVPVKMWKTLGVGVRPQ